MTRARYTFYFDEDQREALRAIKDRDGISESEQIRRAVKAWIQLKGVTAKTERKRPVSRKRSSTREQR